MPFTRGPVRFLYLPNGEPFPVFDISEFGTFVPKRTGLPPADPTYYLGPDSRREDVPPTDVVDHRKEPAQAKDDTASRPPRPEAPPAAVGQPASPEAPTRPGVTEKAGSAEARKRPCPVGAASG
jgi:hypothetical protein